MNIPVYNNRKITLNSLLDANNDSRNMRYSESDKNLQQMKEKKGSFQKLPLDIIRTKISDADVN